MNDICAVETHWRQMLQVHPAADLFSPLGEEDLLALAADIKKHGLKQPVLIIEDKDGSTVLIDGRNRLDALEYLGEKITLDNSAIFERLPAGTDIYASVISLNIHRRHLTSEQKRALVAKLLKADPEKSDRQVAIAAKADHKTVGKVRSKMEGTGEIPQLEKTVGVDGKARKKSAKKRPQKQTTPEVIAVPHRKRVKANSRSARWMDAVSTAADALRELQDIQGEYAEWRESLLENPQSSAVAEKLDVVCDLDIEGALATAEEAEAIELPLGFGTD
jgi:ParB-like chromosome segregation protein Spo0J